MRHKKLWMAALLAVMVMAAGSQVAGETVDGEAPGVLTLQGAVQEAMDAGGGAVRARLQLEESLLQAADWQHQHEMGPPRGHSMTLPAGEEEGTVSITLGEPSRLEKAQVEELLPVKAQTARQTACITYLQHMAAFRAEVVQTYYDALLAKEKVELEKESLQRFRTHHKQAEALFDEGEVAEFDVLQAEAQVIKGEAALRSARNQLEQALIRLNQLTGAELDRRIRLIDDWDEEIPLQLDSEEDLQQALSASGEVAGAAARLQVAEKEMELFVEHHGSFSGRRSYQQRSQAVRKSQHQLEQARREVQVQVKEVHSRLDEIAARLQATDKQVQLLARAEDTAALRFQEGLAPITELLDASVRMREAELARLQASLQYRALNARRQALLGVVVPGTKQDCTRMKKEIDQLR